MNRLIRNSSGVVVLALLSLFAMAQQATSQVYYILGHNGLAGSGYTTAAATSYLNPIDDWYWTERRQFIIKRTDLQTAGVSPGLIESFAFFVTANTATFPSRDISIRMRTTTATTGAVPMNTTNFTTVFSRGGWTVPVYASIPGSAVTVNGMTGKWYEFKFDTPFMWDGVSNLQYEICSYRGGYSTIGPTVQIAIFGQTGIDNPYFPMSYYYADGANYCNTAVGYGNVNVRPTMRIGVLAGIEQSFPDDVDPRRILRAGSVYDGSSAAFPKPSLTFRQTAGQTIQLTYRIVGPLPSTNVVYQARQGGNTTITHVASASQLFTYTMNEATGPLAQSNGSLDLTNAVGGSYRVEATFSIPGYSQNWQKAFIVAFPNDVATSLIRSPLAIPRKYPRGVPIPVSIAIQNVGLNNVTDTRSIAVVRRESNGQEMWRDTVDWTGNLATGQSATIDFSNFNSLDVDQWTVDVCTELVNAIDQQSVNDCLPRSGTSHVFQTLYNEEVSAGAIAKPNGVDTYYANRPFRPIGTIVNGGILDLTDIPVRMEIFQLPNRNRIYNELVVVSDVGAEVPNNIAGVEFPAFTPPAAGQYEVCLTTEYPGDPITNNNQVCQVFTISSNLSGTYTIGTAKAGQARNYLTFLDAANDLYLKGVSGPVTFELTDATYSIGNIAGTGPALDLTTRIIGASATNTITFKPTLERSLSKGSVVVTLNAPSNSGIGFLFGQANQASNPNAIQPEFSRDPRWNNSGGGFIFDGGQQKALVFQLNTTSQFRAPFYLGDGSQDIQIKNCVIRNAPGVTPSYATSLPTIIYGFNLFQFQPDVRTVAGQVQTYSAGIVSRQKLPSGPSGNNSERLDTVIGARNVFENNEISGFGYGITTFGIGLAIKGGVNEFRTYYNENTKIRNNQISDCRRAGIFVAYEQDAEIAGNRIYNIGTGATGGTGVDAAGIRAGGVDRYHNIRLNINANEISSVLGDSWARGIVVEQVRNIFPSIGNTGGNAIFPDGTEYATVSNNTVWGIRRSSVTANLAGVHMMTQRSTTLTGINQILTPAAGMENYFTTGDRVVNNTIVMNNDNLSGSGLVAGLGIQHGGKTFVRNNAIVMEGTSNASSFSHSALLYQGTQMTDGNDPLALNCDRNAYQLGNASFARFIEITSNSEIVSTGSQDEFKTMSQWRSWTRRDLNSVTGNVAGDLAYTGIAPKQALRVKSNPAPIGSILSNRGETVSGITTDIDGQQRGAAGQLRDLGADEFDGRTYVKDLEVVTILKPSSYKASTGQNSDAEYIMTAAPVDVSALVRNSGGLSQTNVDVRVRIYNETAASNNAGLTTPLFSTTPVVDKTVKININAGTEAVVNFGIENFAPQTYAELVGYTAPSRFSMMTANVTPLNKIEVTVSFDENNANNTFSKVVRFYLRKADSRILISSENAGTSLVGSPAQNTIVGRLNSDSVITGLNRLGFMNNASYRYYDVFDRLSWEERAVDYTLYRSLFWASDMNAFSRFERRDLRAYMSAGNSIEKKNLAVSGQNYPRQHVGMNVINDEMFINTVLRVANLSPGTPVPTGANYDGKRVRGDAIARSSVETVAATGFAGDAVPNPALVRMYSDQTTGGLALPAYVYLRGDRQTNDSLMGSASSSLTTNVVYLGVDWRHWRYSGMTTGIDRVLRGTIDFFEKNGGTVVPVELVAFDAKARGNNVDVFWATASEQNADHFVVERAKVAGAAIAGHNDDVYEPVATVTAAGNSTERRDYSTIDRGLETGTYLYRLVSVDRDGSMATSGDVQVVIGGSSNDLSINSVSPNPVRSTSIVEVMVATAGNAMITLVDAEGRTVATLHNGELSAGLHSVDLSVANLASGAYTLVLANNGEIATAPVSIVR